MLPRRTTLSCTCFFAVCVCAHLIRDLYELLEIMVDALFIISWAICASLVFGHGYLLNAVHTAPLMICAYTSASNSSLVAVKSMDLTSYKVVGTTASGMRTSGKNDNDTLMLDPSLLKSLFIRGGFEL
jgi:predicted membrane protein